MTTPLFDYSIAAELRRLADAAERQAAATEGLFAMLAARLPDLVAAFAAEQAAPADFDSAQYADDFDAKMGNPLAALGKLTATAAPAADPVKRKQAPRINWSKLDPRSRELAKLRTAAEHRAKAAKTPETRTAAALEAQKHHNESKARQRRLQLWLAEGKGIIDGDALCYFDAAGTKIKWVPSPTPNFFLPY
jgi:hypothetical protein